MKPLTILCLFFLIGIISCQSTPKPHLKTFPSIPFEKRLVVAVPDFDNQTEDLRYDNLAKGISELMIEELLQYERVRLVERTKLNRVLAELKIQLTGLIDHDTMKEVGILIGADALLIGNLSSVTHKEKKLQGFLAYSLKRKSEVLLSARLVDVETGEILASSKASSFIIQKKTAAMGFAKTGGLTEEEAAAREALEGTIKKLANDLAGKIPNKH